MTSRVAWALPMSRVTVPQSICFLAVALVPPAAAAAPVAGDQAVAQLVRGYCLDCHDSAVKKGGLSFEELDFGRFERNAKTWEAVVRKLHHRQMPPAGEARPTEDAYRGTVEFLAASLDRVAAAAPDPGRTDTLRRLNRTEYQNAIRDLLALEIDATALLPNDEPSHGFDNVLVGNLSPTLLDRYVSAAQTVARLAIGAPRKVPGGETIRLKPDITQEEHVPGLPLGTRGGTLISHVFPQDGDYEFQLRLARDRNEQVEGLRQPHELEVLLDRAPVATFSVKPPGSDKNAERVDAHLKFRVPVQAGPRKIGVTFLKNPAVLLETERQPFLARFNMHRHPRTAPALYQVTITGPFNARGPGDTPSRRRIFGEEGRGAASGAAPEAQNLAAAEVRARRLLEPLMRRAYRGPVTDEDLRRPLQFFREGCRQNGFEAGFEQALSAVLVSPRFLFRVEEDPPEAPTGTAYRLGDFALASRLAFLLWSSLPDDALLDAAGRGELRRPGELARHARRMLADPRSRNLVTNFAAQWLHLRSLETSTPDLRLFTDFDDNLRQAFRQETELFFESIVREDRPITDLLGADYTFLNERLARHYGIPHVHGSRFRRVSLAGDPARQRGGLLRHGSLLTVTSYATRTSPVLRGNWILANLVGSPPPPPPPNTPTLEQKRIA
ncbi:MAG: DUF1592 domain-containing protein, partial [Verrucomicrobia bacterium]|nr:DUF1592 domain-containing protein [Verrucomicrobiota bacterium]